MLTVTDNALEHLSGLLKNQKAPDDMAVRCVVNSGQLALTPDAKRDGDVAFEHGERTVLLVQKELCDALDGRAIDVDQSKDAPQLMVRPQESQNN